jgi:hypothetical protein
MRIAVQNPQWICTTDSCRIHDYGVDFLRLYRPVVYLSRPDYRRPFLAFMKSKGLDHRDFRVVYTRRGLGRHADVLICFNGAPHVGPHRPVRRFDGLKIYHVMDYTVDAAAVNAALEAGGVDYVMAYSYLDRYDSFFRTQYPRYEGRVLNVPFGFHPRFHMTTPFAERRNKCVALGAVNPVRDPLLADSRLREFTAHFAHEEWAHKFRRLLVENADRLRDVTVSTLPVFPETKNTGFDLNDMMNAYRMFVTCESILFFPPAKAFEGPATGAVMVCSDHECNRVLGFVDGDNCITHRQFDVDHFRDKVAYYIDHPDKLEVIHDAGMRFVRSTYSHEAVARKLYADMAEVYAGRAPGAAAQSVTEREEEGACRSLPIAAGG